MYLPSLKQLQYLVAVVEQKHFGKAAEQCFVSQSTLSAGIQELENALGVQLLERSKRKVTPTTLGESIALQSQHLLTLAREMVESTQYGETPLSGPLRLGVIPTISPFLLPLVLPELYQQYPKLQLQLIEKQSPDLVQQVSDGTLDAAILAFPFPCKGLQQQIFWQENFLVAMHETHPLARKKSLNTLAFPPEQLLLLEQGHCLTDHALSVCHLESLKTQQTFAGTSLFTLLQMVLGKQGITFVPEMMLQAKAFNTEHLVFRPLEEKGPHREIGLIWRKQYFKANDLTLLGESLRQILLDLTNR